MLDQPHQTELDLYPRPHFDWLDKVLTSIDLFCGAGGLTAGFKLAGFRCLYGNDCNPWAIQTFKYNHPEARADSREIEAIDPSSVRRMLRIERGGAYRFNWWPALPGILNKRTREVLG